MTRKLLVICGPTATGKTSLALHLAKVFKGELISADSRQIYKKMDIGTGKDLPVNAKWQVINARLGGFYKVGGIKIWGYDLVEPTKEFSVARYIKKARKIIKDICRRDKLPILVGGTGFYIKGVVDGIPSASIPKNKDIRKSLEGKNVDELFEILRGIDPIKAASLNISDRRNPRRLIRAIEIAMSKDTEKLTEDTERFQLDTAFIGLKAPRSILDERIKKRVDKRVKQGIEREIRNLLKKGVSWEDQAMDSLGYKQWAPYSSYLAPETSRLALARGESTGQRIRKKVIEEWKRAEKQYAKRQMTWFKRDKRINWFDITKKGWKKSVERLVRKWYSSN
jgi:tRNA dimethylallyltransferase